MLRREAIAPDGQHGATAVTAAAVLILALLIGTAVHAAWYRAQDPLETELRVMRHETHRLEEEIDHLRWRVEQGEEVRR